MDHKAYNPLYQMHALEIMEQTAHKLYLQRGVAVIFVKKDHEQFPALRIKVIQTCERLPDPHNRGPEDSGSNYFGIAMEKVAFMLSTSADSGMRVRHLRKGESPHRGGLAFRYSDLYIYIAFSGGSEDQDVEISEAAARFLKLID